MLYGKQEKQIGGQMSVTYSSTPWGKFPTVQYWADLPSASEWIGRVVLVLIQEFAMEELRVCQHHGRLDEKLSSIDERLARIEDKLEPLRVIGRLADDNRKWLQWLTGLLVISYGSIIGLLSKAGVL